jgi:acetyl-CoA carboxylase biotin carboxyl carrier protein
VARARKASRKPVARVERAAKAPAGKPAAGVVAAGFELRELRQLIALVQDTGIGELELTAGGRSVRISATSSGHAPVAAPAPGQVARAAAAATVEAPAAPADNLKAITSPMVGTFYRSPAPDAEPFVESGDAVAIGQTVCIIEAMKLMNEIEAEFKGRIVQILVENAQPVEFGQKLFLVEPV